MELDKRRLQLSSEELDKLERKLYIQSSRLAPGSNRSIVRGNQKKL